MQDQIVSSMVKTVSDNMLAEIEHGGCVDEYLRDQLVVYQALAEGLSNVYGGERPDGLVGPSLHAQTAQWVAKEVLGVEFDEQGECEGIGFDPGTERESEKGEEYLAHDLERLDIADA